jgi:hypothetical protein
MDSMNLDFQHNDENPSDDDVFENLNDESSESGKSTSSSEESDELSSTSSDESDYEEISTNMSQRFSPLLIT